MMRQLRKFASVFATNYPRRIAYMWQASEYSTWKVIGWWVRVRNFRTFVRRGDLVRTNASRFVGLILTLISWGYILLNALSILIHRPTLLSGMLQVIVALLLYPITVVILSIAPVSILGGVKSLLDNQKVHRARKIFANHPGVVIAVAGSYGKTSMKELLVTILSIEKKVRSTKGNKNTIVSQADFGLSLDGDEDYLIIELGEGAPGDIAHMTSLIDPDFAVITGLAPNHLDQYDSLDEIAEDFTVLADHVGKTKTFMNADSDMLFSRLSGKGSHYSSLGAFDSWTVYDLKIEVDRLVFELEKHGVNIKIDTKLVGEHNVGPISFAVAFASMLGTSKKSLVKAVGELKPYEHRMQVRTVHDAWFVDDTYNGNIEGMKAGLEYLRAISVKGKKIYATPGLVDQGRETELVHTLLGEYIANAKPDVVYIMQNSVTQIIKAALEAHSFGGRITIIHDPLSFYTNIQDVLAKGDVILCQNDWPDVYY